MYETSWMRASDGERLAAWWIERRCCLLLDERWQEFLDAVIRVVRLVDRSVALSVQVAVAAFLQLLPAEQGEVRGFVHLRRHERLDGERGAHHCRPVVLLPVVVEAASAGVNPQHEESAPDTLNQPDGERGPYERRKRLVVYTCCNKEREDKTYVHDMEECVELGTDRWNR